MTSLQKFILRILPAKWAASIEADSRSWMARCANCGAERSVWEMGGIKWKASGSPSMLLTCSRCKKTSLQKITRISRKAGT